MTPKADVILPNNFQQLRYRNSWNPVSGVLSDETDRPIITNRLLRTNPSDRSLGHHDAPRATINRSLSITIKKIDDIPRC